MLNGGSVVQIPSSLHHDTKLWGEDAEDFNARRFVGGSGNDDVGETRSIAKVHPRAFRVWGGGVTLCPGRWAEISAVLLLFTTYFLSAYSRFFALSFYLRSNPFTSILCSPTTVNPPDNS